MRTIFITIGLFCFVISKAQVFTVGGASQMYWKWRPDISDSCYEFTFMNVKSTAGTSTATAHGDKVSLVYWNDCDYGKNYVVIDSTGFALIPPLNDTLFRVTSNIGLLDNLCGYNIPYNTGNILPGDFNTNSPNRRTLIYRGVICLPEKCRNWHFAISSFLGVCVPVCHRIRTIHNGTYGVPAITNTISNIDSFYFDKYLDTTIIRQGMLGINYCSMNNLDFPDNNSVEFISPIMYYFPIGKEVEYNPGALDTEHDSLLISIPDTIKANDHMAFGAAPGSLGNFFKAANNNGIPISNVFENSYYFAPVLGQTGSNPIRYNGQNNPFDTDSTFNLVSNSGRTTFTAQSEMQPLLFYTVKKYRNNKFVNQTYTINQFTLLNDPRPMSYLALDSASLQGVILNADGTFTACANKPISFEAAVKVDFLPSAYLKAQTTADTTLPGNGTCIVSNQLSDSVHLTFSWTPPINAKGLYHVYITAKDSNCSAPYLQYTQVFTWSFHVDSCLFPIGIPELISESKRIQVYPNPANEKVHIVAENNFSTIKICNLFSQVVSEINLLPMKQREIDIAHLPNGIYIVTIDKRYTKKLVISR